MPGMTLWIAGLLLLPANAQTKSIDQVYARYESWAKTHKVKKVVFEVSSPLGPKVTGTLLIDGNRRLLMRSKEGKTNYVLSALPTGVVDIDYSARTYDEQPYPESIYPVQSRISELYGYALPGFLFRNSLKQIVGEKAKVQNTTVPRGDEITAHLSVEMGSVDFTILVDPQGRILHLHRVTQSIKGSSDITWNLSYPAVTQKLPDSVFRVTIPLGSSPFTVDGMAEPIQRETAFPLKGWRSAATGQPFALKGSTLVAVLDQTDFSSSKTLAALKTLRSSMAVVSVGNPPKDALNILKDPSGANLKKIAAPATPFFVLVNAEGKVARTWMGFDPAHSQAFVQQVLTALKQ